MREKKESPTARMLAASREFMHMHIGPIGLQLQVLRRTAGPRSVNTMTANLSCGRLELFENRPCNALNSEAQRALAGNGRATARWRTWSLRKRTSATVLHAGPLPRAVGRLGPLQELRYPLVP
mmetsp:Transcript_44349/g.96368  ORF Transcript_44349/g.96368 Transcript_44349/m.96368 type:complete len:123 (-) Transcript_44349:343-711(-)